MAGWQPEQYLRFEDERTRPCRDLVQRISIEPGRIIDLGCGPGNSTVVLAGRWPDADITGLDSSESMLRRAADNPRVHWTQQDIADWAAAQSPSFDLVFSNAALQWVDDHARLFTSLMRRVAAGGALAVQLPADPNAPAHRVMRERFPRGAVREWHVHEPAFYYDLLAGEAHRLDMWVTEYLHVLPSVEAVAEWYRSTGLRPFLDALPDEIEREQYFRDVIEGFKEEFAVRRDGRVLFPFRRLFLIAYA